MRYFISRDLNPHITACYHDSICRADNFVNIFNSFAILNFGDDIHMFSVVLL